MGLFVALLIAGVLLSIVGAVVEGLLWLTVLGAVTFLGAAAYPAISSRSRQRRSGQPANTGS